MTPLDNQQIELLGYSVLRAELIRQGFETATPDRDKGYDIIIYTDPVFRALPIQMKCSSGSSFNVNQKYSKFDDLVIIHVWNIMDTPRFFILTQEEAVDLVPDKKGKSWTQNRKYNWPKAPKHLTQKLEYYENRWHFLHQKLKS